MSEQEEREEQPVARCSTPRDRMWLTVGTFGAMAALATGANVTGLSLDSIALEFGLSMTQAGLLVSIFRIGIMIGAPAGGFLTDRLGAKHVALVSLAMLGAGMACVGLSGGFGFALSAMIIFGVGGGFTLGFAVPLISSLYTKQVGLMFNLMNAIFSGASVLAGLLGGLIIEVCKTWRVLYFGVAVVAGCVMLSFVGRQSPTAEGQAVHLTLVPQVLRNHLFAWLAVMMVLVFGVDTGMAGWLCIYLQRACSFSAASAGAVLSVFWVGMTIGRLTSGIVSRRMNLAFLLSVCGIGTFICWSLAIMGHGNYLVWLLVGAAGFFHGGTNALILSYARHYFLAGFGTTSGMLTSIGAGGGFILAYIVGVAADRFSLTSAVLGIGFADLAMASISFGLWRWQPNLVSNGKEEK